MKQIIKTKEAMEEEQNQQKSEASKVEASEVDALYEGMSASSSSADATSLSCPHIVVVYPSGHLIPSEIIPHLGKGRNMRTSFTMAQEVGSLQAVKAKYPHLFNFNVLDDFFKSFQDCKDWEEVKSAKLPFIDEDVEFRHGQHLYWASIHVRSMTTKRKKFPGTFKTLNIKISNDGFLYPENAELSLKVGKFYDAHISRNAPFGYPGYSLVDNLELAKFPTVVQFASKYLDIKPEIKLEYSFESARIDFLAINDKEKTQVQICFEPGAPLNTLADDW